MDLNEGSTAPFERRHQGRLAGLVDRQIGGQPAARHHQDAVGDGAGLQQVGGGEHHHHALVGQAAHGLEHLAARADIDAPAGFVQQQHQRVGHRAAPGSPPSAGCPRTARADRRLRPRRPSTPSRAIIASIAERSRRPPITPPAREIPQAGQAQIAAHRKVVEQGVALAVLGRELQATPAAVGQAQARRSPRRPARPSREPAGRRTGLPAVPCAPSPTGRRARSPRRPGNASRRCRPASPPPWRGTRRPLDRQHDLAGRTTCTARPVANLVAQHLLNDPGHRHLRRRAWRPASRPSRSTVTWSPIRISSSSRCEI